MAEEARNRHVALDPAWILPLTPPPGVGIVTPSCTDRTDVLAVPIRTGQGLRIGGEANLCFRCGPGGSVYHPGAGYSMADVRREADRLPFVTGYDPADLTPAVLAAFEHDLRAALDRGGPGSVSGASANVLVMSDPSEATESDPTPEERARVERALAAGPAEREALVRTFSYRDGFALSVMLGEAARAAAPGRADADAEARQRYATLDAMFELLVGLRLGTQE